MKRNEVFPSNFLKADDLIKDGKSVCAKLTIASVTDVTFNDDSGSQKKQRVLHFKETTKQLGLNSTNWGAVEKLSGIDDDDHWAGVQIEVYRTEVEFKGKYVPAVRVRPVGGWEKWAEQGGAQKQDSSGVVADPDDLPF